MTEMPTRRVVLRGAAAGGVVLLAGGLSACGGTGRNAGSTASIGGDAAGTPDGSAAPNDGGSASSGGATAQRLVAASDVPVGGGVIVGQTIVVTQPVEGEFKGFSALCTHQHCPVSSVDGGTINCPCHGSRFSIDDGSVKQGPATEPLPAVAVQQQGEEIVTG
jgi:Rieske Fe-S protein